MNPNCFGCIPARAATLITSALGILYNTAMVLHLSHLRLPEDLENIDDDGFTFQESGLLAALNAGSLWSLVAALISIVGLYGVITNHSRALRLFAIHGLVDSLVGGLVVASFALVACSARLSTNVGRMICAEIVRGSGPSEAANWFDFSRSAEACEERIGTGFALLLTLAAVGVVFRSHCAWVSFHYYIHTMRRNAFIHEMSTVGDIKHDLKTRRMSSSSTSSRRKSRSRSSSEDGAICGSPTSLPSPRIILLPAKANSSGLPSPITANGKKASRRHTYSPPPTVPEEESVLVYAPIRMSVEEAAKLGGREIRGEWR